MAVRFPVFRQFSATDANAPAAEVTTVTGAGTYYSAPWSGLDADGYSATTQWTGTVAGTLTMWSTDKPFPDLATDADWVQDTTYAPTNPAGAAGISADSAGNAKGALKRQKLVVASGTGTIGTWVSVPRGR